MGIAGRFRLGGPPKDGFLERLWKHTGKAWWEKEGYAGAEWGREAGKVGGGVPLMHTSNSLTASLLLPTFNIQDAGK